MNVLFPAPGVPVIPRDATGRLWAVCRRGSVRLIKSESRSLSMTVIAAPASRDPRSGRRDIVRAGNLRRR